MLLATGSKTMTGTFVFLLYWLYQPPAKLFLARLLLFVVITGWLYRRPGWERNRKKIGQLMEVVCITTQLVHCAGL